jgi:steroid delta-isomerase-like uncharacterized protein
MSSNRDIALHAIDRWNAGDLDGYLELYHDDLKLHGYSDQPMSKEDATGFYKNIQGSVGNSRIDIHQAFDDDTGHRVVLVYSLSGTHTGEMAGVPPTGNPIKQDGITVLRFRDGKVIERWSAADFAPVLMQIGAIPS